MYPSEYTYRDDSVSSLRAESSSANCEHYRNGIKSGINTSKYIHCDGSQLQLSDSNLGQEQYQSSDHYWWLAGSAAQLLFVFSTRISLTTTTLHYYSDSVRGLPRLRFFVVPDNFDVWCVPTTSHQDVDVAAVPSSGEPSGRRNVSIKVNFNIKKVLMYKYSSSFQFAVSEVEFFNCESTSKYP